MQRDALRGFLQIGVFIGVTGFLLALFQPRSSGEFVASICSGVIGMAIVLGVIIVYRFVLK
jgi:hypothetical protein